MQSRSLGVIVAAIVSTPVLGCPVPGPMTESIAIITQAHPELIAVRDVHQLSAWSDWDAHVRVGYSHQSTAEEPDGVNAAVQLQIPLFGKGKDTGASARHEVIKSERSIVNAFIREIDSLCELVSRVKRGETMREFVRDRVEYRRKRVDEGIEEPEVLWTEAKAVQDTDFSWVTDSDKLSTLTQTTARRYGGGQWKALQESMMLSLQ